MALSDYLKILKTLVTLADDLQRYNSEIKEIRKELRDLTLIVSRLGQEVVHSEERAESERERMRLEIENAMLKFEKRLSPGKEDEETK